MASIEQIRKVLGDDVADALYQNFPGQQLYIPKKFSSMIVDRDEYIYNLCIESGKTYDEIADMMELSKDRVQKIVYAEYEKRK